MSATNRRLNRIITAEHSLPAEDHHEDHYPEWLKIMRRFRLLVLLAGIGVHLGINGAILGGVGTGDERLDGFEMLFAEGLGLLSYVALTFAMFLFEVRPVCDDSEEERSTIVREDIVILSVMLMYGVVAELSKYYLFFDRRGAFGFEFSGILIRDCAVTIIGICMGYMSFLFFGGVIRNSLSSQPQLDEQY